MTAPSDDLGAPPPEFDLEAIKAALEQGDVHLAAGLYPEGTEFLQSLRYLDEAADGSVIMASRMKELRYGRKYGWRDYATLRRAAAELGIPVKLVGIGETIGDLVAFDPDEFVAALLEH